MGVLGFGEKVGGRRRREVQEFQMFIIQLVMCFLSPESLMLIPPTTACFCGLVAALHHFLLKAWVLMPKVDFFSTFCLALVGLLACE
jgi:hypothetical protein